MKKIYKFFWILCMIGVVIINCSIMIQDLPYDYMIFGVGIVILVVGIIGSISTGTLKMIWKVISNFL